ncbi:unnamed protein product [marine sediment metagenome]|uniref:Uncharacterized protein n=1 Tax=marine sediment metagenome TaxID=412755 RepID=X1R8J5_9ZZZZ
MEGLPIERLERIKCEKCNLLWPIDALEEKLPESNYPVFDEKSDEV